VGPRAVLENLVPTGIRFRTDQTVVSRYIGWATRPTGLEVNADKTKYMVKSRVQNAGRNHNTYTDNGWNGFYTNFMQQLWIIDKPMTQHVSGIIVPIFRSARLYIWFSAFKVLAGVFGCWQAGRGQCVEADSQIYAFNVGWESKNALLLDAHQPLMFLVEMMYLKNKMPTVYPFRTSTGRSFLSAENSFSLWSSDLRPVFEIYSHHSDVK